MMMSPSSGLANRSFLYGGGGGGNPVVNQATVQRPTCLISDKIVYATLDSLALRRATLPLRLLPPSIDNREDNYDDVATVPRRSLDSVREIKTKSTFVYSISRNDNKEKINSSNTARASRPNTLDLDSIIIRTTKNADFMEKLNLSLEVREDRNLSGQPSKKSKPKKKESNENNDKKGHREFTFAKNVLHYVPMTSRRYYRKSRKLACKSLSMKSLGSDKTESKETIAPGTLKSRSLSRDELKFVTISRPSNFVHVASATRASLVSRVEESINEEEQSLEREKGTEGTVSQRRHTTHEGTYADLRGGEYADIALLEEFEETATTATVVVMNDSFLWRNLSARKLDEVKSFKDEDNREGDYDDVGPPMPPQPANETLSKKCENNKETAKERYDEDRDTYDDVGPAVIPTFPSIKFETLSYDDQVYDDVMPLRSSCATSPTDETPQTKQPKYEEKTHGNVEEADEEQPDEDVYDDVGLPSLPVNQECHERVNSLYAGSSASDSIHLPCNPYDKESEWEDLDDAALYGIDNGEKLTGNEMQSSSPSKKKLNGQRWSRKIRRQRSRASRKSSGRSTSRSSRTRVGETLTERDNNRTYSDSSDDSNYETLEIYEPDDFSSDSEPETASPSNGSPKLPPLPEPPNRPVPPPPREASLGYSLGRRMKIFRRTWSITKGSLGRMRRRASAGPECEQRHESSSGSADAKKYFNFKKHFRKSQATALSTFYLDKSSAEKENEKKEEPIYSNSNWYREVGLYANEETVAGKLEAAVDHYSVLAEEPLYQFYAAAATRVAFESDSDGYEEVEELAPSTATTEFAKPGHRTLWCQTPQVINSGLLQSLTTEERKIQEAKFEILTSEASYLNSLRVLENEFASNYKLVYEILTPAERDKLFGAVPEVLVASERFLAELETNWQEDPMLGKLPELLLKHGERSCNVYVNYCSNQVSIDNTLKEFRSKKGYKFLETVSRIEMHPACQSLSLHSFLMLPMQRITRLPLLADAVLSKLSVEHNERHSWERALATLSQIVAKCNEGARHAERRNEVEALVRKLEYSGKVPPIDLQERELIRSGTVIQLSTKSDTEYKLTFGKKFHKTPLMLMLLTDYLLVTKLKSNSNDETFSVIDTCKRSLVALESAPEDSPFSGRHAMILTLLENHAGRQVEYVLTCENDTEKERWLDAVSPPKPTCVGETLYESWDCPQVMALYSYAPQQPDELPLQPGDVINVLRKMNDGWLFGEKLLDGEQGWFPGNFTKEVASEHVRARNLRQRHRFMSLSGSVLQRKAKQSLSLL